MTSNTPGKEPIAFIQGFALALTPAFTIGLNAKPVWGYAVGFIALLLRKCEEKASRFSAGMNPTITTQITADSMA